MKRILLLSVLFFSVNIYSYELPKSTVKYFATWNNKIDVQMNTPAQDQDGCGSAWVYRIDLDSDPGAEAKLATIMLAFSQNKEIGLSLGGCSDAFPRINGIRVYQ